MIQRNYNANLQMSILTATNEWTSRHCLAAWMLAMEARHGAVCKDHRWMMNGLTVHLLVKSTDISVVLRLSSSSWDVISLAWLDNVRGYRNTGMQVSFCDFCACIPWLGFTRCHTSSRGIDSHLHAGLPSCLDSCNLQNLKLEWRSYEWFKI